MSKAIKCDTCGLCFDPYSEEREFASIKYFTIRNGVGFTNNEYSFVDENVDLCPDCLHSYNLWFSTRTILRNHREKKGEAE